MLWPDVEKCVKGYRHGEGGNALDTVSALDMRPPHEMS